MPRRGELPAEAVSLEVLGKVLEKRRLEHLETIGTGKLSDADNREHIGRVKEDKWLIDQVAVRLKQLYAGDDQ